MRKMLLFSHSQAGTYTKNAFICNDRKLGEFVFLSLSRVPFLLRNPTHSTMDSVVEEGIVAITLVKRTRPTEPNHIRTEPIVRFHKTSMMTELASQN